MIRSLNDVLVQREVGALLLYSESYKNADMYYLTKFLAPDPFIYLKPVGADPVLVINPMEYPRAQKESTIKDVRSYHDYDFVRLMKASATPRLAMMDFLAAIVEKELPHDATICVPHNFPALAADVLREKGLRIQPMFGVIEKMRETKDTVEIKHIAAVQRLTEEVTAKAIGMIAEAEIGRNNKIYVKTRGRTQWLTAGKLKALFGHGFLDGGCVLEEDLIVASGPRGADPHYRGNPDEILKAHQPIVLDVYPRSMHNRYWTDMTRTVVKGRASPEVRKMFNAVWAAKDASIDALHEGVLGSDVYNICCDVLEKAGYVTARTGQPVSKGFMHGLGHGVGLALHEGPGLNRSHHFPLESNSVVTVEPGLYDPRVGGMRIEDLVEITAKGCRNFTKMDIVLEI